uniref:sensor histidine kinase n=1 Tax=Agathobacter sp. TaxID=2021311 RepID=UPI004055AE92
MEIQIIVMSILSYLILFNSSLTFQLKIINNVIITAILAFHIVYIGKLIGSLFVIPMFVLIILYVSYLKKEEWLWNVFLIIFSYTLLVIVDNLTHFVWSMIGLELSIHWPVYMLVDYPIFFVICRFMSKKVVEVKNKKFLPLSPRILTVLGADLILCMLIFVMHIAVVEQAGSSPQVLLTSIILYISYVVLTFLMVTTIVREYETNANIMLKQNSYDNLQEYMTQIEELYQNIRVFRHDYANIMVSMAGYIEENDMAGLKKYYDKQIFPISNLLNKEDYAVAKLHNLDVIELKSLISVKVNYALEMNIEVNLEITEKIDNINMKSVDLVRIMGILLDNAIEACKECEKPNIRLSIIKMGRDITFIVKNTYVKQDIDYSKLGSLGMSSKGERRGTGLYNIKTITNTYDNVIMDTEYENGYFTQLLEIYG